MLRAQPAPEIVLRDIHRASAPSLWPLAPGWWLLAAGLLVIGMAWVWWIRRRRAQRRAIETLFDQTVGAAGNAPGEVAAISALLRRAARRQRADADVLEGEDWLAMLDEGMPLAARFAGAPAELLLDGGFRRDIDPAQLAALREIARDRFLRWMGVQR